jgi:hypothetical protein
MLFIAGLHRKARAVDDRRYIVTKNAPGAHYDLQKTLGDACAMMGGKTTWFELKAEETWTGNLFLETWSNRPVSPGWMFTSRADYLLYYFRTEPIARLYFFHMPTLQKWAFGEGDRSGAIYAYREVRQRKSKQRNDTTGRCVPINVLTRDLPYTHWQSQPQGESTQWEEVA